MRAALLSLLLLPACPAHVVFPPIPDDLAEREAYFHEWSSLQSEENLHEAAETRTLRNGAVVVDAIDMRPFAAEGSALEDALDRLSTHEPVSDFFIYSGAGAMIAGGTLMGALFPVIDDNEVATLVVVAGCGGLMAAGITSILLGVAPLTEAQKARAEAFAAYDDALLEALDLANPRLVADETGGDEP